MPEYTRGRVSETKSNNLKHLWKSQLIQMTRRRRGRWGENELIMKWIDFALFPLGADDE
jgi:hypothetical protein